jgi:hypothetical protein
VPKALFETIAAAAITTIMPTVIIRTGINKLRLIQKMPLFKTAAFFLYKVIILMNSSGAL